MRTFLSEAFSFLICRIKKRQAEACRFWSWWRDSDPRPIDYESIALPLRHTSIAPTFAGAKLIIALNIIKVNIFRLTNLKGLHYATLLLLLFSAIGKTSCIASGAGNQQRKRKQKQSCQDRACNASCGNTYCQQNY